MTRNEEFKLNENSGNIIKEWDDIYTSFSQKSQVQINIIPI